MLDDVPPPPKRLKLQAVKKLSFNKENKKNLASVQTVNQQQDVRKRKVPAQRRLGTQIMDLNSHVLLEVIDYLNLEDLCNLADVNYRFQQLARQSFRTRANNHIDFNLNRPIDCVLLKRLLNTFGDLITSITISTRH